MTTRIPETWLTAVNRKMGQAGILYSQRPFEAIRQWAEENHCSMSFPSPEAKAVFEWFEANSPQGAHAIGALFTATFFFDSYFWKVAIPHAYGKVCMNVFDCIEAMPDSVKQELMASRKMQVEYCALWVDAMDYAYGLDDLRHGGGLSGFAARLVTSADRELRATVHLLTDTSQRPNAKAMESARMAAEMFLKGHLAKHAGLVEADAQRKFGHNLVRLAEECATASPKGEFDQLGERLSIFPEVGARYEGNTYSPEMLWAAYCLAQVCGISFVRSVTDRDSRSQMFPERQHQS